MGGTKKQDKAEMAYKGRGTALVYLRVSTAAQAKTDRDGEGFSIAAQRDACLRKAEALNADVLEVYVDAGESARKADRPELQRMLARLIEQRDSDYVIVHKVDRLARNRGDDVTITLTIRQAGAQLVSVTENIDETPSGMLVHGIMSSIAEFYSQNLAAEVVKGTSKKVERGGYPGRAPIGYRNVQDFAKGNELRWIEVDPERAEHVTWAFEAYASGDYTLRQLAEVLDERGLRSVASAKADSKPVEWNQLHRILRNPFYVGRFVWKSVEYDGNHEAIVDIQTFARVQAQLEAKRATGERTHHHEHYLKGTIFCGRCGSRMIYSQNKGRRGSTYYYFVCLGRHAKNTSCDLPYVWVSDIESQLVDYYKSIELDTRTAETLYRHIIAAAAKRNEHAKRLAARQRQRIVQLENERRALMKAHYAGAVPLDILKEEQERIKGELATAGALMTNSEIHWESLEANLDRALSLASRVGSTYEQADDQVRRQLNQAIFEQVLIEVDGSVAYARMKQPFAVFQDTEFRKWVQSAGRDSEPRRDGGSNETLLVGAEGLEPPTC
jgi:DNA invertase Pin-like site-specific DNA recombinase